MNRVSDGRFRTADLTTGTALQSDGRIPSICILRSGWHAMEFSIDHLGIAVKSLAAAKSIYEKLGLSVSGRNGRAREGSAGDGPGRREPAGIAGSDLGRLRRSRSLSPSAAKDCITLPQSSGPAGRCRASEERRRASCLGRNQDRRGRTSICVCASVKHRWRAAGTGAG